MLVLNKEHIKNIFTMKEAIEADKEAFSFYSQKKAVVPLRTNINVSKYNASSLFMPGYIEELDALGIKIVSVFPENSKLGKPVVPAQMILLNGNSGEVCCIMDGTYLTQLRTGAASGAATDLLAVEDAKVGALIGTGGQAICQLEAMLASRNLEVVKVYSRNEKKVIDFIEKAKVAFKNYKTEIVAAKSSDEVIENADVITVATTSTKPVFDGRKVKRGAHINGVGSYMPNMQEIDEYTIANANKIFVDSKEAVLSEAGDFIIPLEKNIIDENKITGELGEVVSKKIKGREHRDDITVFKSVGIAVQDVTTAYKIYKKAIELGIGTEVQI